MWYWKTEQKQPKSSVKAPLICTSALESVVNDEGGTGNGLKLDDIR